MADANAPRTAAQIALAMHVTKRSIERRALNEAWPFQERTVRGGRMRLYPIDTLPMAVQAMLVVTRRQPLQATEPEPILEWSLERQESVNARLSRATDDHKAIALRRLQALDAVSTLVHQGHRLLAARGHVAAQLRREGVRGGTAGSLARWAASVEGAPRNVWQALLLPSYQGCTVSAEIPADAWNFFLSDWLRPSAPSASAVFARLQRIAREHGWKLPSLDTFERRLKREVPRASRVLAREGEDALKSTFPAQERDVSMFEALDAVNADGHKFDVFVRMPSGEVARPIMIGVQDLGSRKLLGYRVAETESANLARLAFLDVVRTFGIPREAWLDNGRAFASKLLTGGTATRYRFKVRPEDPTGVLTGLGMKIHWTEPYAGQAKPIERAWREIAEHVSKHPRCAGAYTGNRPDAKPEDYGTRAVGFHEFMKLVATEIAAFNARQGRRNKRSAGRSYDQVFNESYARSTIRKATAEQLRQLLLAAEVVKAGPKDGAVRLGGNRYWDAALVDHAGARLTVRFDPQNLHAPVACYTAAGVFIADAACVANVGFADVDAGREHSRARRQHSRAARDMLAANRRMAAAELAAQIPDVEVPALPSAPVIAPVFGKGKRAVPAAAPAGQGDARATGTTGSAHPSHSALDSMLERMSQAHARDAAFQIRND